MAKRKAISNKLRFEVFKRDKFRCQYCGRSVPDVVLQVDHIKPVSKGGNNNIMNLITSCEECNSGKSNIELDDDSVIKKQQSQIHALAERREQLDMFIKWKKGFEEINDDEVSYVSSRIAELTDITPDSSDKKTIKKLLRRFSLQEVLDATDIAYDKYFYGDMNSWCEALKKIGGICYNKKNQSKSQYYYNYLRKSLENKFMYYNNNILSDFVDLIKNDQDFNTVKEILNDSYSWTMFRNNIREAFGGDGDLQKYSNDVLDGFKDS